MFKRLIIILLCMCNSLAWSCTSVIISGRMTKSGLPVMMKHRDTGCLQNAVRLFHREETGGYEFIGIINVPMEPRTVWSGTNEVGFCIINTAAYNFREDTLQCPMDREGEVMYKALTSCRTVSDFEHLLDTLARPMGVETNFGVTDAAGGACYYEVNNFRWIKHDVNAEACGYKVVTNFCESGRREDYHGWERFLTASQEMEHVSKNKAHHAWLLKHLSRNFQSDSVPFLIPRPISTCAVVMEYNQQPLRYGYATMWTALGYPASSAMLPVSMKCIPECVFSDGTTTAPICDISSAIKGEKDFAANRKTIIRKIARIEKGINREWKKIIRQKQDKTAICALCEERWQQFVKELADFY